MDLVFLNIFSSAVLVIVVVVSTVYLRLNNEDKPKPKFQYIVEYPRGSSSFLNQQGNSDVVCNSTLANDCLEKLRLGEDVGIPKNSGWSIKALNLTTGEVINLTSRESDEQQRISP